MNLKRWVPSPPESKWPTAALLCFVNLINYMDRYTISGRSILKEGELIHVQT